jgi:monovalent cation:H+ antiporter-2, CPA2 family
MFPADLVYFLVLISAALITFVVSRKIRLSLASGYLLCGVLLGPFGFGLLKSDLFIKSISEIGILLLLFTVGLEIPLHRLKALRHYIFGLGLAQVAICTLLITLFLGFTTSLGRLSLETLCILGLVFSFSSTAIIVQLLSERFEMTSNLGRKALAILLFQDIAAIVLFVYLGIQEKAASSYGIWFNILGLFVTLAAGLFLEKATRKIFVEYRYHEAITPFLLIAIIGMGMLTQFFSLSSELGAFVAGMFLARTTWRHEIHTELHAFRTLFLAIFFMTVGLEIDISLALSQPLLILTIVLGLMILKSTGVFLVSLTVKTSPLVRLNLAALMWGGSEFLFVVMPYLETTLPNPLQHALLFSALVSMMCTPFLFVVMRFLISLFEKKEEAMSSVNPKIIVSGFGHVGETIAHILEKNFIPFLVIDHDETRIRKAEELGYSAVLGSVQDIEFIKRIGIQYTKVLLITFGHRSACIEVVKSLRQKFPELSICVQVSDYVQANRFVGLGVHLIVPEPIESGMQMAAMALKFLGFKENHARQMIDFPQTPVFLGTTTLFKKIFHVQNRHAEKKEETAKSSEQDSS